MQCLFGFDYTCKKIFKSNSLKGTLSVGSCTVRKRQCCPDMSENVECKVESIDHIVLTVANIDRSITFYTNILGMTAKVFGDGRYALHFGTQKINLHQIGHEFMPHAFKPTCGSVDICFVTKQPLDLWMDKLKALRVTVEEGPVPRTGALAPMNSLYIRDPDNNLVEIAYYS
ncbi:Glyoxalase domain-containing protein 5 [Pseudolycoriella hygida]|uniref:Glyoxalase domain-containing protein 5 n=1 Tax=Pseudolycoriella hygida TaxID=35572 RepID=A0A9Q0MR47_9DIPT|nr:Glyoxalase domain-containing protein 5 [Pseudolycoriella hygida]